MCTCGCDVGVCVMGAGGGMILVPLIKVYKYVPYFIKVSHVSCGWRAKSKFLNAHRSSVVCLQPIALH